jgi:hypothetical protein
LLRKTCAGERVNSRSRSSGGGSVQGVVRNFAQRKTSAETGMLALPSSTNLPSLR